MRDKIDSFQGEYRWLSNFHPISILYEGVRFPSTEHAYQGAKCMLKDWRLMIANLQKPSSAKIMGQQLKDEMLWPTYKMRTDWTDVSLDIMYQLNYQKYAKYANLRQKLFATGDAELIEGNTWNDTFWGVCNGKGENHLGKILMRIRKELQENGD